MVIKDDFILLRNTLNLTNFSSTDLKKITVKNGIKLFESVLMMMEDSISHLAREDVYKFLKKNIDAIEIINTPDYALFVTYNKPTKQILININSFGVDNITPTRPDPKNLYACLVYGICLRNISIGKYEVKNNYYDVIVSFLLSMFVQMFGREYGLIGKYSNEIPKLKFLTSCYILTSFFGESLTHAVGKSSIISGFNPKEIGESLFHYDFNNIEEYIKAVSEFGAMPGITKFHFTSRCYKFLGVNFLPALEDISRFIATIAASSVAGNSVITPSIYKYNKEDYIKILAIATHCIKK